MIAFVLDVIRRSTSAGSMLSDCGSMSANTGTAPRRATASAVAKNVNEGQITSSPSPMPSASSAITIASVPFATPTVCSTPRYAAASRSKPSTSGPKMKRPDSRVRANASLSSGISGAYCALTSTWGIGGTASHGNRAATAQYQIRRQQHDSRNEHVLDVVHVVPCRVPARPDRPADPAEAGAEGGDADDGKRNEAPELQLEEARRDRDERPDQRRREAERHRDRAEACEPAFGALDPRRRDVQIATVSLEQRTPAVEADRPAGNGADAVAGDAGDHEREVGREAGAEAVAEDSDVARKRPRGERTAVEHRQLA